MNPFKFAIQGIYEAIRTQLNMKIHAVAMVAVIIAGFYFRINSGEWIAIILCIGVVLTAELINTAIEYIVDFISPDHHVMAGKIKDLAAGAVLVISIAAAIIGTIIFLPKCMALFN